jgi:hypothetical protein
MESVHGTWRDWMSTRRQWWLWCCRATTLTRICCGRIWYDAIWPKRVNRVPSATWSDARGDGINGPVLAACVDGT